MNNALLTIAPVIEALRVASPSTQRGERITSSVRLLSVALSRPPIMSPVLAATDSVGRLSKAANRTRARTESTNRDLCARVRASGRQGP